MIDLDSPVYQLSVRLYTQVVADRINQGLEITQDQVQTVARSCIVIAESFFKVWEGHESD